MAVTAPLRTKPETPDRILDAAFQRVGEVGLSRTTVEDVARGAGLTRQTIYRYFPSKDQMILALVLREQDQLLDGIREAFRLTASLDQALFESALFCLRWTREHPLLDRLLATDADTLLPYLTTRAQPLIEHGRDVMAQLVAGKGWVRSGPLEGTIDVVVRALLSYTITPPDRAPQDVARDLARMAYAALTGKEASR